MAKNKEQDPPEVKTPEVKTPEVKTIKVTRNGKQCFGGPTEAEIPETSLPSWAKNGWRVVVSAMAILALALFVRGGAALAEEWNATQAFTGAAVFNGDTTLAGGVINTPTTAAAALTASLDVNKYDVSAAGGAYVISLPASTATTPADGQCWEFSMTVAGAAVSFSPSAVGDLLDASQAAYAGMDALGDSAKICYDAGTTNYYFQSRYIH